jgi:hypothetical protein
VAVRDRCERYARDVPLDVASHGGWILGGGGCEVVYEAGQRGQGGPNRPLVGSGELVKGVAAASHS